MRCSICDQSLNSDSISNIHPSPRRKISEYVPDTDTSLPNSYICIDCQEEINETLLEFGEDDLEDKEPEND